MSTFYAEYKNKKTGEIINVRCIDDYFRHHVYGYLLPDGRILTDAEINREYTRVFEKIESPQ